MEIKNKVCLITGSAIRVGKSIAQTLASEGAKVAIHYRSQAKEAQNTADQIIRYGGKAISVKGDISIKEDWINMKNVILNKWETIDILINNAAIFYKTPFFSTSESDFDKFLNINLKGVFIGCQVIGEIMYQNKSGKIF